jgi:hypothetical protein
VINKITGVSEVELGGETYSIKFDWDALSAIKDKYGDAPNMFDASVVADVAAIGMAKHHPDITAEKIKDISPPLIPFADAVQTALQYAYFGAEAIPKEDTEEKKTSALTGWWNRIKQLLGME